MNELPSILEYITWALIALSALLAISGNEQTRGGCIETYSNPNTPRPRPPGICADNDDDSEEEVIE